MNKTLDILIDGSGSMGYMNGTTAENKYLLADGKTTRTELVKKIMDEDILPIVDFFDKISVSIFRMIDDSNKDLRSKTDGKIKTQTPYLEKIYSGMGSKSNLKPKLSKIKNPKIGGTPLCWALNLKMEYGLTEKNQILIFSDGDNNVNLNHSENWAQVIKDMRLKKNNKSIVHIIGIDQDNKAQIRSKLVCQLTGGNYTNLKTLNYSSQSLKTMFDSVEVKTKTITNQIIKNLKVESEQKNNFDKKTEEIIENRLEDQYKLLKKEVLKNSNSLNGISKSLDHILQLLETDTATNPNAIDIIENQVHNHRVGRKAEKILFEFLSSKNFDKVEWMNEKEETMKPYDFIVWDKGQIYYYECKGTSSNLNEFFLSKSEWAWYLNHKENYRLCFIGEVDGNPTIYRFENLILDIEKSRLDLYGSKNRKVKADSITLFVNKEKNEALN